MYQQSLFVINHSIWVSDHVLDKHTISVFLLLPAPHVFLDYLSLTRAHKHTSTNTCISIRAGASVREERLSETLLGNMSGDYFGFSFIRSDARNTTNVVLNNAADISVIVIYFLVVLGVGIWVSCSVFQLTFQLNPSSPWIAVGALVYFTVIWEKKRNSAYIEPGKNVKRT